MLFGTNKPLRTALDKFGRVSGYVKEGRFLQNTSKTAINTFWIQALTGTGFVGAAAYQMGQGDYTGAAATIATPLLVVGGAAKLMTFAPFVNWLSDGVALKPTNFKGIAAHIGKLTAILEAQPEYRDEIEGYMDNLIKLLPRDATL